MLAPVHPNSITTLEQAQKLPFTELKIDRSKVAGCSEAPHRYRECHGIVALAHRLDMVAVGEGVESERDLQALTQMGCDAARNETPRSCASETCA